MEERLRTPSIVSDPLRACAHPRGIPATGTQRLATPDRTKHHASSVTIRRDARAPIRSGTGFIRHLSGASGRFCALPLHPLQPIPLFRRDVPPSSASAVSIGLLQARSPFYGLPCDLPRSWTAMRTDRLLLPTTRLRAPAPRSLPASLRGLRLALGLWTCTHDQETGGPGVSRRPIRFGGPLRVGAGRSSSSHFRPAVPLTPLSRSPFQSRPAFSF